MTLKYEPSSEPVHNSARSLSVFALSHFFLQFGALLFFLVNLVRALAPLRCKVDRFVSKFTDVYRTPSVST